MSRQKLKSRWFRIAALIVIQTFIFTNFAAAYPTGDLRGTALKHNPDVLRGIEGALGEKVAFKNSIGVPREIITGEKRVVLTPKEVEMLVNEGIEVTIEKGAGIASGFSDEDYLKAGARIASREDVWQKDLIIKVKEPQKEEMQSIRKGQTIFAFLHLAAPVNKSLTETLLAKGATAIAFETIEKEGEAPILSAMSAIAGPLAAEQGQLYAGKEKNKVVVLGGGVVGKTAAERGARLGNEVIITELNGEKRKELQEYFKGESLNVTVKESWTEPDKIPRALLKDLREADIIIGAVYVSGSQSPVLIDDKVLSQIGSGKIIVDVAVDQGGNIFGSRPTTLDKPTFPDKYGNTRFCVRDIPSLDSRKASISLAENIVPYVQSLATRGLNGAIKDYPELSKAVSIQNNRILNGAVARVYNFDLDMSEPDARVAEIEDLLERIDRETKNPGAGQLTPIAVVSDYHGEINLFLRYIADAISQRIGKEVNLEHTVFPEKSIDQQLKEQGIDIKEVGMTFYLLGDFLDRGPYGIKCFRVAEELVNLGVARYVTGNHDLWAFLNIMGFSLPAYKGYNFYGQSDSEKLVEEHWNDPEIVKDRLGWWTEKLAEYNSSQQELQEGSLDIVIYGQQENIEESRDIDGIRKGLKELYLSIKDQLNPEEKELWQDLVGFYFDSTDVYTGFNGVGMMSVKWWEERKEKVDRFLERARKKEKSWASEIDIWEKLKSYTDAAAKTVREKYEEALGKDQWWYQVFNDINHENYTSVEWWGKDWSSHKGWGTTVIDELNALAGEKKWNQANYINNPHLKDLALFYRKYFTLYLKDPYGNFYTHGCLPVDLDTGQIRFAYQGVLYEGEDIWKGLEKIQNDIRDLDKPLSDLHEALNLVNSWYADKTTKIKPENIEVYVKDVGLEKIYKNIGIKTWFTCHNPLNKLHPKGVGFKVQQGEYLLFSVDKGMSYEKFNDLGGYAMVNDKGVRLRGHSEPSFKEIIDSPPTLKLEKDEDKNFITTKTWENESLGREDFLSLMKKQLEEELEELKKPANRILVRKINEETGLNEWENIFPEVNKELEEVRLTDLKNNQRAVVINYRALRDNPSMSMAIINANRQLGKEKGLKFVLACKNPDNVDAYYQAINKATNGALDLKDQFDLVVSEKSSPRRVFRIVKNSFKEVKKIEVIGPKTWAEAYQKALGIRDCIIVVCEIGQGNKVTQGDLALWTGVNALVDEGVLSPEEKQGLFALRNRRTGFFVIKAKNVGEEMQDMIDTYREVALSE